MTARSGGEFSDEGIMYFNFDGDAAVSDPSGVGGWRMADDGTWSPVSDKAMGRPSMRWMIEEDWRIRFPAEAAALPSLLSWRRVVLKDGST